VITRNFADGPHQFLIGFDECQEWERIRGRSLFHTTVELIDGKWLIGDIVEVIRLALIGAGTEPGEALSLTDFYVKKQPLAINMQLAIDILEHAFFGIDRQAVAEALGTDRDGEVPVE